VTLAPLALGRCAGLLASLAQLALAARIERALTPVSTAPGTLAALAALQARAHALAALESTVASLRATLASLRATVASLRATVASLRATVASLRATLEAPLDAVVRTGTVRPESAGFPRFAIVLDPRTDVRAGALRCCRRAQAGEDEGEEEETHDHERLLGWWVPWGGAATDLVRAGSVRSGTSAPLREISRSRARGSAP
jgi:hypothetical protein